MTDKVNRTQEPPTWVVDTSRGSVGRLMDKVGPNVQLRPPRGGREWEARTDSLRLPSGEELRQAGVSEAQEHPADGDVILTRRAFVTALGGITSPPATVTIAPPPAEDVSAGALEPVAGRRRTC